MAGGSSWGPWGVQVSLLVPSPVSEVFSRWLEAVPKAPGGSRFLCSFLHLFRRSSQVGWRQLPGPKGVPGFSARSFTCFGGQYHRHCLFVAINRALHSSSSTNSSHSGRSLFVSLRFKAFCKVGLLLQGGAVSEVISRWLEALPGAPGGSWLLCSFLHLFRWPSQGGWRQFLGPMGVPGFSARSFTCFGGNLKVVGGSSKGPRRFLVSLLVPSPVSEVISRWLEAAPGAHGGSRFLCSFLHLLRRSITPPLLIRRYDSSSP